MKERDPLEKFILENRDQFDDAIDRPEIWDRIEPRLRTRRRIPVFTLKPSTAIAAGILFLISGALGGRFLSQTSGERHLAALERSAPEFLEAERYYQGLIRQKTTLLAGYPASTPVFKDLHQLDQAMNELKNELHSAPAGKEEEIIANLIQVYQMKISILELVLQRINQMPSVDQQKKSHETSL